MTEQDILKTLKGTKDFMPEEQLIRNFIIDKLKHIFEIYGYLPLESAILNPFELLASKYAGGAEILKEVYKLKDQGLRNLGLRYDLTVPFAKVIASDPYLTLPFRRYEIGKVFRDGPVKLGRSREFYQCDVDVCGIAGNEIEVELFEMILLAFESLNLDVELIWNNRKFLSGIILESGIKTELVSTTILIVDKLDKYSKADILKEMESVGIAAEHSARLFEFFALGLSDLEKTFNNTNNQLLAEGLQEVKNIVTLINMLNLKDKCRFVPFLARGLEIYTGTVWEIKDKTNKISSSLGGGGRYDNIITNFVGNGTEYPAVGTSFGLEPIYELLRLNGLEEKINKYDVYVYAFDLSEEVFNIARQLRQKGFKTIVELQKIKLKKALAWADKNNINNIVIIGEDEIKNNVVSYKNMAQSTQETLTLSELIAKLNK